MSSEGPTTVGSINAYLELNIERFLAKAAEAKAAADELDGRVIRQRVEVDGRGVARDVERVAAEAEAAATTKRPTIRPQVDTTAAVVSEGRLKDATREAERTAVAAVMAEMRLTEVKAKRGRTALQVLAAEEALTSAMERAERATTGGIALEDRLAAARKRAAAAAVEEAAASEVAAKAVDKTGESVKKTERAGVDMQTALIGALVAIAPAAVPLAAAATGIAGGFTAMGAAGVLGIAGIVRGMKDGTEVGKLYQGTVHGLQDDLHGLQDAAARGLLPGVEASASVLHGIMPALSRGMEEFAGYLGGIMPTGLDAVVTLVSRAAPLFREGARYAGDLFTQLDRYAHGNGFATFLQYAEENLPKTEQFIGDVIHLAGTLLSALAPFGSTELDALDGVVTGLDHILQAIKPIVPAIAGVALAFGAWRVLAPIVTGITGALKLMGLTAKTAAADVAVAEGVAAAGAGGAGVAGAAGAAGAGAGAAGAAGVGFLGKALKVAAPLAKASPILGITTPMGHVTAEQVVGSTSSAAAGRLLAVEAHAGGVGGGNTLAGQDAALARLVASGNGGKAAAQFQAVQRAAAALHIPVSQLATDYPQYSAALAAATAKHAPAVSASQKLTAALESEGAAIVKAAGSAQGVEGTYDSARDGIDAMTAAVQQNGTSLDQNTAKGRANREATLSAVSGISAAGDAWVKAGHSQESARVRMDTMAVSLENNMVKLGMNRKAAAELVGTLMGFPKGVTAEVDLKTAKAKAAAAQAKAYAEDYAKGKYQAILDGDFTKAQKAAAQARLYADDYRAGKYQAILDGDFTKAQKAAAAAAQKAEDYAQRRYLAYLSANGSQALAAIGSVQAAINRLKDKSITLTTYQQSVALGNVDKSTDPRQRLPHVGGTAGTAGFGYNAVPGMAGGGTGYTVSGPGTAATDTAGWYRLANGEEVVSNLFGQADAWRPMLKAINAGRVDHRTFEALAARAARPQAERRTTIAPQIHVHNPVAVDPVAQAAEATQYALAYAGLG